MDIDDQQISIPSYDGKTIYALFNQASISSQSNSLVILAHGLTGHPREFLHVMAAREFVSCGYDVARISFYDGWPNARTLRNCTVDLHARDLNTFVNHYRQKYPNIFIAGHSYGGFSLLFANPSVNAVSFWDSTWTPGWHKEVSYIQELDCFALNHGKENLIGRPMYEEADYYANNPPVDTASRFQSPAQVVLAGANEKLGRARDQLFQALGVTDKELIKIDKADHQFTQGRSVEHLITSTKSWFNQHLK
ncbi:MAG: alpha/beta hydrolase [Alphaproteobacteria bacterium]|nr:alpha/beta hydrolase [Alphaproteobacteria bacterium]MBP9868871.1 alpha/beta hydrolase [Alphaproteobacteria bacterium]